MGSFKLLCYYNGAPNGHENYLREIIICCIFAVGKRNKYICH